MTVLCSTILLKPMLPTIFSVMSPRLPTSPLQRDFGERMAALWHLTLLLILQAFHDHPLAGHMGVTKMTKAVSGCFYWPLLLARDYICNCTSCWLQTTNPSKPAGLMQPLEVPPHAWHTVTTDYITSLPLTPRGKMQFLYLWEN